METTSPAPSPSPWGHGHAHMPTWPSQHGQAQHGTRWPRAEHTGQPTVVTPCWGPGQTGQAASHRRPQHVPVLHHSKEPLGIFRRLCIFALVHTYRKATKAILFIYSSFVLSDFPLDKQLASRAMTQNNGLQTQTCISPCASALLSCLTGSSPLPNQ